MHDHYSNKYGNTYVNFYALLVLLSKSRQIYFLSLLIVHTKINPTVQEARHSSLPPLDIERVY